MELYDSSKDYKRIHLEWIKANKGFRPQRGIMPMYNSYFDEMLDMYQETLKQNTTAYIYLRDDYEWSKKSKTINQEVASMFGDVPENTNPTFFITFNWNDTNFDIPKILNGVGKLFSKSWIDNARGVFEYHGSQKNHPHFMCLLQVNKHKSFGRIRDKIFQSALGKTLTSNFIDIKVAKTYHQDYLDLDKCESKQESLAKDVLWRKSLGLNEEYKNQLV